ncbi:hypothetical protein [uncultured Dokdonia sp.]|uniref:hypothetical protein n=1 Tax=uncultured Dokdonia sp. TaxID=575653 RepID=UPI00260F021C|nr:hypothetical protein [uncultured Dokdonia sp.]
MKNTFKCFLGLILICATFSCAKEKEEEQDDKGNRQNHNVSKKSKSENLNISFLLDLSDRINPRKYPNETMEYYMRDAAYIKSVSEAFTTYVRVKKISQMNEKIQMFFEPAPKNKNINSISENLKFEITKKTASLELLNDLENAYSTSSAEIYKLAIEDNKYVGSDIWGFFKNKVKDYCIEEDHRNILVVLTDGYNYHEAYKRTEGNRTTFITPQTIRDFKLNKPDWEDRYVENEYGFIPAARGLENLEVLVLGINPDPKNPYEGDVIKTYWSDWLESMDVKRYSIKNADLPSNMDGIIKDFVLGKS